MARYEWWNDRAQLDAIYNRFMAEGYGRRAFLRYVATIGGSAAVAAAAIAFKIDDAAAALTGTTSFNAGPSALQTTTPTGELIVAQGADAETLDPARTTTRSTWNLLGSFYETLVKVTFTDDGVAEFSPGLATSWNFDEGSELDWTVTLREGVAFHNGEPFDANAAKFTIDRMLLGGSEMITRTYVRFIENVEIVDDYTLKVTTVQPYPLLPLDFTGVFILPPVYTTETDPEEFARAPIGTGAFKFVEWVRDDHLTVEANLDYWGGPPLLQTVRFLPIPEASTRAAGLATGDIDVSTVVSIPDVGTLQGSDGITVENGPSQRTVFIQLNNTGDHPLANQAVRQALNYAVNKDAIIENVMQGYATILQGQTITPQFFGFNPDLAPYPYDPDRARELLAEAGYADGFDVTLYSPRGRYIFDYETSQAVAGLLAEVGVNVTVEPLEWAVFIERLANSDLNPMVYFAWSTYNDGARMMEAFSCGALYSHTCIEEFDAVYHPSRATLDVAERERLIHETTQVQHDQAMALFLYQLNNIYATRSRVQGFRLLPNESFFLEGVSVTD